MCEFCAGQCATNARAERVASFILTDIKERVSGPKATVRFVQHARPVALKAALAGANAAMKSLDKTMSDRKAEVTNCGGSAMGKVREFLEPTRNPDGSKRDAKVVSVRMQAKETQQYQPILPPWNEPRLSDARRQALESQAVGLRAQLATTDLTPANRIRLEQELTTIERVLGRAGSGDALPRSARSM